MIQSDVAWYEAFRSWEQSCRGWRLWDFAVELEPPFFAITPDRYLPQPIADDAKVGGGIKGLLSRNRDRDFNNRHQLPAHGQPDPVTDRSIKPRPFYRARNVTELQLKLPRELDATPAITEQLLLSFGNFKEPVGFEIFADSDSISIQLASSPDMAAYLKSQLKTVFPALSIIEREGFLASEFSDSQPTALADFGLARSFTFPLRLFRSFNPDPLGGLLSSCGTLGHAEKGVFQILFQPAKAGWFDELLKVQANTDHHKLLQDHIPNFSALLKNKLSASLFAVSIRTAAQAQRAERAWEIIRQIGGNLRQYSDPSGNELIAINNNGYPENDHRLSILSRTNYRSGMLLNTSELASLVHLPSTSVRIEKLKRSDARTKALPAIAVGHDLVLGKNIHDGQTLLATLSKSQRTRHTHLIGSTGSGKTTLILQLIRQDLEANEGGVCVIDPHGDLIDAVCESIPESRIGDVVLFDPSDSEYPIGFNIFQAHSDLEKTLISSDLVAAFKRMSTSWGDVMDAVLANAVLAILESSRGGTLLDLKRFLVEKDFRTELLQTVRDESVRYFWLNEFPVIGGKPQASILIRLDAFLRQKLIRNIVCQKTSKLNFREIMDYKKILLIKLSQGIIGLENSHFLGTLLVTKLHQIALSRQETTHRPFFAVYIDEFHNFVVPSMEGILSGIRKYNIALTLSHQEYRQLQSRSQEVAESVMSNCYTRVCFRLGDSDAERFAKGFSSFDASALQNLGVGEAIARVERSDYDFNLSVTQVPAIAKEIAMARTQTVTEFSRTHFARAKAEVEAELSTIRQKEPASEARTKRTEPQKEPDLPPPSPKPTRAEKPADPGSGEHRYLQNIIKRIGEDQGYVATIEKEVFGGVGRIDVALENKSLRIACEIAVTNTTEYEVQNIQKCLSAGFDRMAVISTDPKHLQNIRKRAELALSPVHLSRVNFLDPEHFHLFLDSLAKTGSSVDAHSPKVKGYTVKTAVKEDTKGSASIKKRVVMDILSRVIRRRKRSEEE